jgi:hypothetical protein
MSKSVKNTVIQFPESFLEPLLLLLERKGIKWCGYHRAIDAVEAGPNWGKNGQIAIWVSREDTFYFTGCCVGMDGVTGVSLNDLMERLGS